MSAPILKFKQASLGYRNQPVLNGVNFEIEQGSFVGILGHNGSGKTTILRTVLGLIPPLEGQMACRGVYSDAPRFGYVPQKEKLDSIYPLSAYDVAALGTYSKLELFHRLRGIDHRALIEHSLAVCGANSLASMRYGDLSGGQKQRVLIARALATQPDILAMDEPLAGIDITTQKSLLELFGRFKKDENLTVLMVSHRVQAEKGLFTHIIWVDEGRAVMGPAAEMLAGGKLGQIFGGEL